jgi:2-methylcitrate dehydratase PrpD
LTKDLGKKFYGDDIYKPYPSCRFIHSSIDCALKIVRENPVQSEDIESITLNMAPMHYGSSLDQPFELGEYPQCNANFSLRYNVANAIVRKEVQLEHFTEAFITDPEVGTLARKVNVTGTLPAEEIQAAGMTVKLKDGSELNAYVDVAKGHPLKKPLNKQEIEDKFRANVSFSKTVSIKNAEQALDMLNNLEKVENVKEIVNLLIAK